MNEAIFLATLRQRITSPVRLVLTAMAFFFPLAGVAVMPQVGVVAVQTGVFFAFVLGAGLIGQETSSGVMQLLFTRPVRRWEYVFSRWLAMATAIGLLLIAQILLAALIAAARGNPTDYRMCTFAFLDQVLKGVGVLSVLTLFSSFLPGIGDVAAIVLSFITSQVMVGVGNMMQRPRIVRTGQEVLKFLAPEIDTSSFLFRPPIAWLDFVAYFSTVTFCLAVAIVLINRREISYASE